MSPTTWHNIILFGESGSGKSSIVNMIVGEDVAQVSNGVTGCTFKHESYQTVISNVPFRIFDTAGLDEGDQGRVPHWKAVQQLYTLIRSLDGVSLLIYCMRGRIKKSALANWTLFNMVLCGGKVPIIAVVTGLEQEEKIDGGVEAIEKTFKSSRMFPKAVGCITSIHGRNNEYLVQYEKSRRLLRALIKDNHLHQPWTTQTEEWVARIYQTTHDTKLCFVPDTRLEFVVTVGNVVDQFILQTGMEKADSDKLKATLLRAENKVLKNKKNRKIYSREKNNDSRRNISLDA